VCVCVSNSCDLETPKMRQPMVCWATDRICVCIYIYIYIYISSWQPYGQPNVYTLFNNTSDLKPDKMVYSCNYPVQCMYLRFLQLISLTSLVRTCQWNTGYRFEGVVGCSYSTRRDLNWRLNKYVDRHSFSSRLLEFRQTCTKLRMDSTVHTIY